MSYTLPEFIEKLEADEQLPEDQLEKIKKLEVGISSLAKLQISLIKSVKEFMKFSDQFYEDDSPETKLQKIC